jgi:hypothetical protein
VLVWRDNHDDGQHPFKLAQRRPTHHAPLASCF